MKFENTVKDFEMNLKNLIIKFRYYRTLKNIIQISTSYYIPAKERFNKKFILIDLGSTIWKV